MDWLRNDTSAKRQEAEWDAWELVEDHTREQVEQAYRDALYARGIYTTPQQGLESFVAEIVDGRAAAYAAQRRTGFATRRPTPMSRTARRRARDAVKARAAGLTPDQIRDQLAAEYTAHGIREINPGALIADTRRIRPPTRADRKAARATLARGAKTVVDGIRTGRWVDPSDPDDPSVRERFVAAQDAEEATHSPPPAWAGPPPRAVELDDDGPLTAVRVDLTPDAPAVFARLRAEWTTAHPGALLHPWLTTDPADDSSPTRIRVHLGDQDVGHLPTRPGTELTEAIDPEASHDWALTVDGLLTGTGAATDPWVLRVTVPEQARGGAELVPETRLPQHRRTYGFGTASGPEQSGVSPYRVARAVTDPPRSIRTPRMPLRWIASRDPGSSCEGCRGRASSGAVRSGGPGRARGGCGRVRIPRSAWPRRWRRGLPCRVEVVWRLLG